MGKTLMPHSVETEKVVIGSLLLNPDCRTEIFLQTPKAAFYSSAHSQIYDAIAESNGGDVLSIINLLKRKGILEKVGGYEYVASLALNLSTSTGVKYHSGELTALHKQRLIIEACNRAESNSRGGAMPDETLATLRADLRQIESEGGSSESPSHREILKAVIDDIEDRIQNKRRYVGVLTGYDVIDGNLMGLEPKTLAYLIGRPSMGKTALALNIADNIAALSEGLVLFFSLEMGSEAIERRMLSAESKVFLSRIRSGDLEKGQLKHIINAANNLYDRQICVMDHPKWKTIEMMRMAAERAASDSDLAVIFVDHIQLMRSNKKFNNRHLEVSYISNELKSMAKALNVPVIALSQLNRKVEERAIQKPILSDMKESGDLEQDADTVLAIYRETKESEIMEIGCLKGRDTGTWVGKVHFDRFTQKIRNLVDGDLENAETT